MNEDQIIARAQQDVAARRSATVTGRWDGQWRWLPFALLLGAVLVFFAVPGPLPRKLLLAMGGVCSLRPSHSYFAGGVQFPLESRMMGIYGGLFLTLIWLIVAGRTGSRHIGSKWTILILLIMFMSMVFDGVNSTLAEVGPTYLYTPSNPFRLATGLLSGIALAPLLWWLVGIMALPRDAWKHESMVRLPWDLLAPLAACGAFAAIVVSGAAWSYYPVAIITVAGIVAALAIAGLLVILAISGREGRVRQVRQALVPGTLALLVALGVLAGTALLRWSVTGTL